MLFVAVTLENLALMKIGISDLPQGTFEMGTLLRFTGYSFLTSMPVLSFMVGLNLLLVILGILVANTPLWIAYPYCYSGYLVSCSLHDFTAETSNAAFALMPFLPCAVAVFAVLLALSVTQFGKKEMR